MPTASKIKSYMYLITKFLLMITSGDLMGHLQFIPTK